MKQYRKPIKIKTSINKRSETEGEHIETKVARILENKEKVEEAAPLVYTRRDEGVRIGGDIRTNKLEVAAEAIHETNKSAIAKRHERIKAIEDKKKEEEEGDKTPSTDGSN